MYLTKTIVFAGVAVVASSAAGGLVDAPDGLNIEVAWGPGNSWRSQDNPSSITEVTERPNGDIVVRGHWDHSDWGADWEIVLGTESGSERGGARGAGFAYISNNFVVTNVAPNAQNFVVTVTQAEAPIGTPSFITGSHSGSVSDANGSGSAELSSSGSLPFYEAFIDGTSVRTLFDAPQSINAGAFLTESYGPESFVNEPGGSGVLATVGISNFFRLSPGDDATMVSTFAVVPTPGTISLLAVAGLAGVRRRR